MPVTTTTGWTGAPAPRSGSGSSLPSTQPHRKVVPRLHPGRQPRRQPGGGQPGGHLRRELEPLPRHPGRVQSLQVSDQTSDECLAHLAFILIGLLSCCHA